MTAAKSRTARFVAYAAVFLLCRCAENPVAGLREKLEGRWVEVYHCTNFACNYPRDSLLSTAITFRGKEFFTAFYADSLAITPDTSFEGLYSLSHDTLRLRLPHFVEVFYYRFLHDNHLYLETAYSIDAGGNTIIDFHSVVWCCDKKKRGFLFKR